MKKDNLPRSRAQMQISKKVGIVVAIMLAVSIIIAVTLSVIMFRSLVEKMLEERCVSGTGMLAYELDRVDSETDIHQMLDDLKDRMGCEFTIFEGDKRAYTTVMQSGRRVIGTELSPSIAEVVLQRGESYVGEADILNDTYLCSYVPTRGDNGQINGLIFAGISKSSAERQSALVIAVSVAVSAAAIVICTLLMAVYLKKRVSGPLNEITRIAVRLERGDLGLGKNEDIHVNIHSNDEIGELGRIFENTILRLRDYIGEISTILGAIADGDLTSVVRQDYVGDFVSIKQSLEGIVAKMSCALGQIKYSAEQVSSGSGQMSNSAQALAQGATEQASSVQELAATISDISRDAERTAQVAGEVGQIVEETGAQLAVSVEYVKRMNDAMEHISHSSEEISKIISAIENIAFQTNILALNAAVEAARAGAAGKGFAVVADEVRNLASKSDEAAKATKELIEGSIAAVADGSSVVERVTESLVKSNEMAEGVSGQINLVVNAVKEQTLAISQVTEGIDQISSVVQTNSATSEESAAASEELSTQAALLKQLVDSFRLRHGGR